MFVQCLIYIVFLSLVSFFSFYLVWYFWLNINIHQAEVLTCPAEKSLKSSLHFWNDALIFIPVFSLALFYLHCFSSSLFLFLFDKGNDGAFFCSIGEGRCPVHAAWGKGAASSICTRMKLVRHSPWLWMIVLSQEQRLFLQIKLQPPGGATDSIFFIQLTCILFYCQIMMTILANTRKKNVTDYSFKLKLDLTLTMGHQ